VEVRAGAQQEAPRKVVSIHGKMADRRVLARAEVILAMLAQLRQP